MRNLLITLCSVLTLISCSNVKNNDTIDLSGAWSFKTDPTDNGIAQKWFMNKLDETIILPGSIASNGKGDDVNLKTRWTGDIVDSSWFYSPEMAKYRTPDNFKIPFWLQPVKHYVGAAWYQKEVMIDKSWDSKHIELFMERCHWETQVWIDGTEIGIQNSLVAPHIYDLSKFLKPGKHLISIRVDNRIKEIKVGVNSHSVSDHTQTNWNGIVGKIELRANSMLRITDIQLYPNLKEKKVKVKLTITNNSGKNIKGKIELLAKPLQKGNIGNLKELSSDFSVNNENNELEIDYPMGENFSLWDEFSPNLYSMEASIIIDNESLNKVNETFGMREFKTRGTQFTINDRLTFLRGTLECAIFPLTGYPPTDTAAWMRIFRIARAHGLNHIRFHSWCPPEAAFEAADLSGFYLHVECPSWANQGATLGDGLPLDSFIYKESENIVKTYGNHPSFCILLYGNEPAGANQNQWLGNFINYWKTKDSRRLYSSGAGWPILPNSDLNSTPTPRIQAWGQGLNSIINGQAPRSDYDWINQIKGLPQPTVSHEIGQWCVYPDFKEIPKYTGVVRAKNFEIFKETLENNHLGQLADSFLLASGKLQALCYKADIEAALRTPGFGGFQLLDLHDFPGQGTALVGILNPFWDEKGYITPKEFNQFCNHLVPLVRFPKMIFNSDETLKTSVEVANFGETELNQVIPSWKLVDSDGKIVFEGKLQKTNIPIGNGIKLGDIAQSLSIIKQAQKLKLVVSIADSENSWDIWVYPSQLPKTKDTEIYITQTLDNKAQKILNQRGKVLLTMKKGSIKPEKGNNSANFVCV